MSGFDLVIFFFLVNAQLILAFTDNSEKPAIAEAPATARKLGKHSLQGINSIGALSRLSAAAEAPTAAEENDGELSREVSASSGEENNGPVPQEEVMRIRHHNHHGAVDKSVAGGGVILGGLATTFLVAIFCYIRATRRNKTADQPGSPTTTHSDALSIGRGKDDSGSSLAKY